VQELPDQDSTQDANKELVLSDNEGEVITKEDKDIDINITDL
jgi:hypothetical protein